MAKLTVPVRTHDNLLELLRDALELFFEVASAEEIDRRLSGNLFVTHVEVVNPKR